jgi:3-methyladenine DNA glycosylase/8-oxoguanine DNA glycosylase
MSSPRTRARTAIDRFGTTYADDAGIRLADKPSPLYRLLVLSLLLSARISAEIAVAAARELSKAGLRTPRRMADATWQQRVDALGRGHYRRYDERTATMLGDGAELLLAHYRGDLRRLHRQAGSAREVEERLQDFPGIGPAGAAIFCREVQGVWTDVSPYADERVIEGARRLGLPADAAELAELVGAADLPRLTAACVRAALDDDLSLDRAR